MAKAKGVTVHCECGQSVPQNLWEDHLLAHEIQETKPSKNCSQMPEENGIGVREQAGNDEQVKMAEAESCIVHCQIDECGQSIPRILWEDHLLAHELREESLEKLPVTQEESTSALSAEEKLLQETDPPRNSSQEKCSDVGVEADNNDEQLQWTSMATLTFAASDVDHAECKICNQLIKIADISDHMIAHEFETLEEEEQPTDKKSESDQSESDTNATSVCAADPDMKEALSELFGTVKKDIGSIKVSELIKGVSEIKDEELDKVVDEVVDGMKDVGKDLKSYAEDGITVGSVCEVGFGLAKATTGLVKDLWKERKAKKQALVPQALSSPAIVAVSETLVHHISTLVRKYNIPENWLDQMCSDEHIREIARGMTDWKHIAYELDLKDTEIEEIDMERTVAVQRLKVLEMWKKKFYSEATYRRLLEVFLTIEKMEYAEKLCKLISLLSNTSSHARKL